MRSQRSVSPRKSYFDPLLYPDPSVFEGKGGDGLVARIRTIKPEFWTDGDLLTISRDARLFYIGLWNFSDDNGVMEYSPMAIKAKVFPADDIRIEPLAQELAKIGKVVLYNVNDRKYLYCKNLTAHQVIDRPRKSNLPLPRQDQEISTDFSPGMEGKGKEGNGLEWKGRNSCSTGKTPAEPPPMPEELAQILPTLKRVNLREPGTLFEVWKTAYPDVGIKQQILACDAWAVSKSIRRSPKGWARTLNTWLRKEQDRVIPTGGPNGRIQNSRGGGGISHAGYAAPKPGEPRIVD